MSVREINFTLDADGVKPESSQFGGMQFEDNATVVKYTIEDPYKEKIQQTYGEETTLLYRIDFNSMLVGYNPSENLSEEDGVVKRPIPLRVTMAGERFQSVLLITVVDKDGNEIATISSPPSQIYLSAVSRDFAEDIKIGEGVSSLLQKTENLSNAAQKWAKESEESAEIAENNKTEAIKYSADALEYASSSAKSAEAANEYSNMAKASAKEAQSSEEIAKQAADKAAQQTVKTTAYIDADSTDEDVPSAKAVYNFAQPRQEGKGLSSNDFTNDDKQKLDNLSKEEFFTTDYGELIEDSDEVENYTGYAVCKGVYINDSDYAFHELYTETDNKLLGTFVLHHKNWLKGDRFYLSKEGNKILDFKKNNACIKASNSAFTVEQGSADFVNGNAVYNHSRGQEEEIMSLQEQISVIEGRLRDIPSIYAYKNPDETMTLYINDTEYIIPLAL